MSATDEQSLKLRVSALERMMTHVRRTTGRIAAAIGESTSRTDRIEHDVENLLYSQLARGPELVPRHAGEAGGPRCTDASHAGERNRPPATVIAYDDDADGAAALCAPCAARRRTEGAGRGTTIRLEQIAEQPACEGTGCARTGERHAATALLVTARRRKGQPLCAACLEETRTLLDEHGIAHEAAPIGAERPGGAARR